MGVSPVFSVFFDGRDAHPTRQSWLPRRRFLCNNRTPQWYAEGRWARPLLLIPAGFGLLAEAAGKFDQLGTILQWIEKAFGDRRQANLPAHQSARENAARLVLAAPIKRV